MHSSSGPAATDFSTARRNWMLAVLTLVGVCGTIDRGIISTLLEPIRQDLDLNDSQLGMLAGLAFAVAHAVVAIPAGAIADRASRRNLIAISLAFWSAMTALCGATQNFAQLMLARMGVGAGEAGGQSATMSSVADLFPPERRATAISIFYLNSPLGALLAGVLGGSIAAAYGWRVAMAAAAAPGFLLCIALLFFRDVPRGTPAQRQAVEGAAPFGEVLRFIWRQRALLHLIVGITLISLVYSGVTSFSYAFFMRYHAMELKALGPIIGVTSGVVGVATLLSSGFLTDGLAKRDPGMRLYVVGGVIAAISPLVIMGLLLPQPYALPLYLTNIVILGVWMGPGFATVQNLTPSRMRSTVTAIVYVANGFIGFGLGPLLVGGLSDFFAHHLGDHGLRTSMVITTALGFWAALHFFLATRTLKEGMARAQRGI